MILKIIVILLIVVVVAFIVNGIEEHNKQPISIYEEGFPTISFSASMATDSPSYWFIVDTGATENAIDPKLLEIFHSEETKESVETYGIDGVVNNNMRHKVFLYKLGKEFSDKFCLVDMDKVNTTMGGTVKYAGLIGMPFITKYKMILDFKNNTYTHKK